MGWGALGQAPRAASRDVGPLSGERTVTKHSRQEEAVQGKESKAPGGRVCTAVSVLHLIGTACAWPSSVFSLPKCLSISFGT